LRVNDAFQRAWVGEKCDFYGLITYFALNVNPTEAVPFAATVTSCTCSPRIGCQALIR